MSVLNSLTWPALEWPVLLKFNFQLFRLLSVLFRVRMKWTAKLQRPKSLLKMFCDKIQIRFQNDFGPIMAIYILMQETAHNLKRYWT